MADYWKSQPRKFCDLCKCWMADNKPSRDFHERGKRHQDSVKRKLDELKKKGVQDAKKARESKHYLEQMERGAMKKFKQDIVADPMLAAQYGVRLTAQELRNSISAMSSSGSPPRSDASVPTSTKSQTQSKKGQKHKAGAADRQPPKVERAEATDVEERVTTDAGDWQEAFTEAGYIYYWNSKTGESSWYLPGSPEYYQYLNYVSAAGSNAAYQENLCTPASAETAASEKSADDAATSLELVKGSDATAAGEPVTATSDAAAADELVAARDVTTAEAVMDVQQSHEKELKTESEDLQLETSGKAEECNALQTNSETVRKGYRRDDTAIYGRWQTVQPQVAQTPVDLQLPKAKKGETKVVTIPLAKEPKIVIREKTVVASTDKHQSVEFKKKRPIVADGEKSENKKKRMLRKRDDDDDDE